LRENYMPKSFGYKCAWIAAKTDFSLAVATAVGRRNVRRSSWEEGIEAAYRFEPNVILSRHAFLTPPVDGWVLCVSTEFFRLEGEQQLVSFLCELSRQLQTVVQCFQTHRVVEAHTWGFATNGNLVRLYGYVGERGETPFDIGEQTAAEVSLGFKFFDDRSPEASNPTIDYWAREDLTFPDEGNVMQLAGEWSIDPTTLDERDLGVGWVGGVGPTMWVSRTG
jgi:hypothetical protein